MQKQLYTAKDLAKVLDISESKACSIICECNEELGKEGYITIRGRVPSAYFAKRIYGMKIEKEK